MYRVENQPHKVISKGPLYHEFPPIFWESDDISGWYHSHNDKCNTRDKNYRWNILPTVLILLLCFFFRQDFYLNGFQALIMPSPWYARGDGTIRTFLIFFNPNYFNLSSIRTIIRIRSHSFDLASGFSNTKIKIGTMKVIYSLLYLRLSKSIEYYLS